MPNAIKHGKSFFKEFMRFYFKKSDIQKKFSPIFWQGMIDFLEKNSMYDNHLNWNYYDCGTSRKTCFLYATAHDHLSVSCDFHIALDKNQKKHRTDYVLIENLIDESSVLSPTVCLLPVCPCPLPSREKAKKILIISDVFEKLHSQLLQDNVCEIAKIHGPVDIITTEQIINTQLNNQLPILPQYKKVLSFSNNNALNHWLSILFEKDFILCNDEASSPLRYTITNSVHPFLQQHSENKYNLACPYSYGPLTSKFRNLNTLLEEPTASSTLTITPEFALHFLEQQCVNNTLPIQIPFWHHIQNDIQLFPFGLPSWQQHKRSLDQLMLFVKNHSENTETLQLLATYLLNYIPTRLWYKIERFYAKNPQILQKFHTTINLLNRNSTHDLSLYFAYGTYQQSIIDQKHYLCAWGHHLAKCFDLILERKFTEVFSLLDQYRQENKYTIPHGFQLTELFLTPYLSTQTTIPNDLLDLCEKLLSNDSNIAQKFYGENIFYTALLLALNQQYTKLSVFFDQPIDTLKTQGYLGCLGVFFLKYDPKLHDLGEKLLYLENVDLLNKKPFLLQMKAWGALELNYHNLHEKCMQYLAQNTTYFKTHDSLFPKWYVQAKIEKQLGHLARAKRFMFLHHHIGLKPCLWEYFE